MGGIITTPTAIGTWLDRIDSTRNELIASAKPGNKVAAAFAMADARVDLIESLKDDVIRAKLLRMTDPQIAMVELANNPSEEDRIRVCAIAILSGFTPGDDQFAVFGGGFDKQANSPRPGKLYVKERGFRTLFSHLGIVPEVRTSHPEFVAFGTTGKKIWRVSGSASCVYQGHDHDVDFSGDETLGIPGYESDNVAGVAAKARRRMLQALWIKVSPILTTDQYDDDDPDTVPVSQPVRIDATPVADTVKPVVPESQPRTITRAEHTDLIVQHNQAGELALESLQDTPEIAINFGAMWEQIAAAKTATQLKAVGKKIKEDGESFGDSIESMRKWYAFRMDEITGKLIVKETT